MSDSKLCIKLEEFYEDFIDEHMGTISHYLNDGHTEDFIKGTMSLYKYIKKNNITYDEYIMNNISLLFFDDIPIYINDLNEYSRNTYSNRQDFIVRFLCDLKI